MCNVRTRLELTQYSHGLNKTNGRIDGCAGGGKAPPFAVGVTGGGLTGQPGESGRGAEGWNYSGV
jgi:hypothetical protein